LTLKDVSPVVSEEVPCERMFVCMSGPERQSEHLDVLTRYILLLRLPVGSQYPHMSHSMMPSLRDGTSMIMM